MDRRAPGPPPSSPPEASTELWRARRRVRSALRLGGWAVFLGLALGTNVTDLIGGNPILATVELATICGVAAVLLYFPIAWAATAQVERRLQQQPPSSAGGSLDPGDHSPL